jgi:hypothetical protein
MNTNVNTHSNRRVSDSKGCIAITEERVRQRVVETGDRFLVISKKRFMSCPTLTRFRPEPGFFAGVILIGLKYP